MKLHGNIKLDIIGDRLGEIVVESFAYTKNGQSYFNIICDCGNKHISMGSLIRRGDVRSCGCANKRNRLIAITKHGERKSRLYGFWQAIKNKCNNKKARYYHLYGGKGVKVCDEWNNYIFFRDWALSNGYKNDLVLDRFPNIEGDFEPDNCRWTTCIEQNRFRNIRNIEISGKKQTISQWAKELGAGDDQLYERLRRGWSYEKTVTTPIKPRKRL